jgi:flavin reductase (DIM6/NTAB) family NADH-FMN oxidoreductase RutF
MVLMVRMSWQQNGPSLIAINVRGDDATAENIEYSKEFGVNLMTKIYYAVWGEDILEKNLIR